MPDYDVKIASGNLSDAMKMPEVYEPIFQALVEQSAALSLAKRLPNMSAGTTRISVLDQFPIAYWQGTGTSLKRTTNQQWKGKLLVAEEIACIVPIGINLLEDAQNIDIWAEVRPRIAESMGALIDDAVFQGTNLPATWLTNTAGSSASILAAASAASMTVTEGTGVDLYDDVLGAGGIVSLVEQQGFMVNGFAAPIITRGKLRHVRENRTTTGAGLPILVRNGNAYTLDGEPILFSRNGGLAPESALLIAGDWNQLIYSIRREMDAKVFTEAVISDDDGAVVMNLMQQDMVAVRFTMRLGFQIANPVTRLSQTEATRYPFAVLTPAIGT